MENTRENFDYLFKIVLVGDTNVGKTNILSRLNKQKFLNNSKPTIGVEFSTKTFEYDNAQIKTQIWDTAGQERYHAIISAYYRGACGAVIVYDITDKKTFNNATTHWYENIVKSCSKHIPIMIIGNKTDLDKKREIRMEVGRDAALSKNCAFFETSALKNENIEKSFDQFIKKIYQSEKDKNTLKNKRYARREDLKEKEFEIIHDKNKRSCC